ncbi:hypothetical protein [Paenarthrobacter aurescens]|uniref:hypothetical protein n=1 Tax=Paenarthrobacter aurescens TaxID=43663 RepID=UPI0021C14EBA|nr:hypothetical protein [Paenarthrobacter aurescens]MCT9869646.1 hypothetical protein [Paenarthrobacter aurescens]
MKKHLLPGIGATALMVVALTACGGATASPEPASSQSSGAATSTPTPVKQYTKEELISLVGQVKLADGTSPAVLSGDELLAQYDSVVKGFAGATIEPAACKDPFLLGAPRTIDGSTAAGTTRTKANGFISNVSMTSGVDAARLHDDLEKSKSQAEECKKVSYSAEGETLTTSTQKVEGVGNVPGTVGFKTVMALPDGRVGAIFIAHAVKDGVLISATASASEGVAGGPEAAGALMDQAAALIK